MPRGSPKEVQVFYRDNPAITHVRDPTMPTLCISTQVHHIDCPSEPCIPFIPSLAMLVDMHEL